MKQEPSPAAAFWLGDTDTDGYRSESEARFLEALYPYACGQWAADAWGHDDHLAVSVVLLDRSGRVVRRTLRIDYYGTHVLMGDDDTHQMVYPLNLARAGISTVSADTPEELARMSAEWMNRQLAEDAGPS